MSKSLGLPIISLQAQDRPLMLEHLLRLDEEDRAQRFIQHVNESIVSRYIDQLDFVRDAHFGVFSADQSRLIGLTHLALDPKRRCAEIGVSVERDMRRQGLASSMLARAILRARNIGASEVIMYFLPYNTGLIELARRHGMSLSVGRGEGIARLAPLTSGADSVTEELLAQWAALSERSVRQLSANSVVAGISLQRAMAEWCQA